MKITVTSNAKKNVPNVGDIKTSKHGTFVRQQCMHDGCYVVNAGKPVYEWVKIGEPPVGFTGRAIIKYFNKS